MFGLNFTALQKALKTFWVLSAFVFVETSFSNSVSTPSLSFTLVPEQTRLDTGATQTSVVASAQIPKGFYIASAPFLGAAETAPFFQLESAEKSLNFSGVHYPAPEIFVQKNGARTTGHSNKISLLFKIDQADALSKKTIVKLTGHYTLCSVQKGCSQKKVLTKAPQFIFNNEKASRQSSDPEAARAKLPDPEIVKLSYKRNPQTGDFVFGLSGRLAKLSGEPEFIPNSENAIDFNRPAERMGFEVTLKPILGLDPKAQPFIDGLLVFPNGPSFRVDLEPSI